MTDLALDDFIRFCNVAMKRDQEERIFQQWVVQLPWMSKDTFVPFGEYLDSMTGASLDQRPASDIIKEIEEQHGRKFNFK